MHCATAAFTGLSVSIGTGEAFAALAHLQAIRARLAKVKISCADSTGSRLCDSRAGLLRRLNDDPAWMVTVEGNRIECWLGKVGGAVIAVSWPRGKTGEVRVTRDYPPPI